MEKRKPYRGAKIPAPDNNIRVRRTVCGICGAACNIDAYIENGTVVKVTGCRNPAYGNGYLCARGHANRPYIYHEDRIKTPLRRSGDRGAGIFEPISWDEALAEIGKRLLECKKKYDPSAVVFTGGCDDWTAAALARLARSFGSVNYGNAGWSLEHGGAAIASGVAAGCPCRPDIEHAGVVLMWGCNLYNKGNTVVNPVLTQKRGAKVVAIDPRVTVMERTNARYLKAEDLPQGPGGQRHELQRVVRGDGRAHGAALEVLGQLLAVAVRVDVDGDFAAEAALPPQLLGTHRREGRHR